MPASLEDYEILATIGTGSYGICKKIRRRKDGRMLVWKELDYGSMTESEKQMLVSEVNLLRELRHKHIVRYYDRIIDRTNTTLYIIMEYCEGGDLSKVISKAKNDKQIIEEVFIWKISSQIVSALSDCHSLAGNGKKILHRDLKPANVFLDGKENVKLGDFGLARVLNHDTSFAKTFVGTPYYMSPEQMNFQRYNEKSDVWSLGCLMYELCCLRPPFTACTSRELASKICIGRFTRIPYKYSDELNTFISCLLKVDETKRPSVHDLTFHPKISKQLEQECAKPGDSSPRSNEAEYSAKLKSLDKKEAILGDMEKDLRNLERYLKQKEKELDAREVTVSLREKIANERLERMSKRVSAGGATPKPLQQIGSYNSFVKDLHEVKQKRRSLEEKENVYKDIVADKYLAKKIEKKCVLSKNANDK